MNESLYTTTLPFPEVYEAGSGETLVLLHGFTETWRVWVPILKLLEPHFHIIAPTLPGHVDGLKLNEPAKPMAIAKALGEQLRARGITKAHFVGQSLGGWMAFEMARQGLARSAMGLSPGGAWRDDTVSQAFVNRARGILKSLPLLIPIVLLLGRIRPLRKILLASEMQHGERVPYAALRDRYTRIGQMTILKEFLDAGLQQIEPMPADFKVPLNVTWCELDTTIPFDDFGIPMLERLGLKTHGLLKGCGHNPMFDDPEGVTKAILDFTRSVERNEKK